jgi:membrane-bound acyltransferase YfiQ involved in biofilm formation
MTLVLAQVSGYVVLRISLHLLSSRNDRYVYDLPLLYFFAADSPDHANHSSVFTMDAASMIFVVWHFSYSKLYPLIVWPGLSFGCGIGLVQDEKKLLTAEMGTN